MKMYFENNILVFDGALNELFPVKEFSEILEGIGGSHLNISIKLVPRANSIGLALFISCIFNRKISVKLSHCPSWYSWQACQLLELNSKFIEVVSVYAPYINTETKELQEVLIDIGPDFMASESYENIETIRNSAGDELSADFDKEEFFCFLSSSKTDGGRNYGT